ncbi:MAG: hypothetical protein IIB57_02405 [Planctomycetes bacterium]|nr:hypothetical protein [Planctomycetota bacterium]
MSMTSLVRKTYDGIALFSVLNVVFAGGLFAYLISSGAVDAEKFRKFVAVIRGAELAEEDEADADPAVVEETGMPPQRLPFTPATAQIDLEVYRREADRIQEELRQRLALSNSILLRTTTERQNFRREREEAAKESESKKKNRQTKGFRKQVAILEGVKPKTAIQHLLNIGDLEEAAAILMEMDDRKAKQIVEAAKTPAQRQLIGAILKKMKDAPTGGPAAP